MVVDFFIVDPGRIIKARTELIECGDLGFIQPGGRKSFFHMHGNMEFLEPLLT